MKKVDSQDSLVQEIRKTKSMAQIKENSSDPALTESVSSFIRLVDNYGYNVTVELSFLKEIKCVGIQ